MAIGRTLSKKNPAVGGGRKTPSSSAGDLHRRISVSKTAISAPVALISTTNMISYTSPSLRTSVSHASLSSAESSPSSSSSSSSNSPLSSKFDDASNHHHRLSTFFAPLPPTPSTPHHHHLSRSNSAHRRSQQQRQPPTAASAMMMMANFSRPSSITTRLSGSAPPPPPPPKDIRHSQMSHPFGAELAQVAEMAEEITGLDVKNAEEEFMMTHGLQKFRASEYEVEIWEGMGGVFEDEVPSFGVWI